VKPIFARIVTKFSTFHGTRNFIIVFTKAHHMLSNGLRFRIQFYNTVCTSHFPSLLAVTTAQKELMEELQDAAHFRTNAQNVSRQNF
jgi:hypothetical protein